ncbi:MAG: beta-glucanase, partial [Muribaculaceae bacterium]
FNSQGTYVLPIIGLKDAFVFMADRWTPESPSKARYIWLPILFNENEQPYLKWFNEWSLDIFKNK